LSIGNYWIYEYVELDEAGIPIGEISIDSSVVVGTREFQGKIFYTINTYRENTVIDTSWWHTDNLRINQIVNKDKTGVPNLKDTIFKMVEIYTSNWLIMLRVHDSVLVEWEDSYHRTATQFRYNGYRNYGGDTIMIGGEQHITMSFKVVSDAISFFKDTTQTVLLNYQPSYHYYKKNIGPIMIQKEPYSIVDKYNLAKKENYRGWRRQMIRTNLK